MNNTLLICLYQNKFSHCLIYPKLIECCMLTISQFKSKTKQNIGIVLKNPKPVKDGFNDIGENTPSNNFQHFFRVNSVPGTVPSILKVKFPCFLTAARGGP